MKELYQFLSVQILEGHLTPDNVHMCIAIPPKHPVASVILDSAVMAAKSRLGAEAASGSTRSGCHPEGELRSSWKLWVAKAENAWVAAQLPDLGLSGSSRGRVRSR